MEIQHRKQLRDDDCGVACVATLLKISVPEALQLFEFEDKSIMFTNVSELRKVLAKRFSVGREVITNNWETLIANARLALVAVNYREDRDRWHWVVYDASNPVNPIMDPLKRTTTQIDRRTNIASYFHVRSK